jgi:hypothetical protein
MAPNPPHGFDAYGVLCAKIQDLKDDVAGLRADMEKMKIQMVKLVAVVVVITSVLNPALGKIVSTVIAP